MNAMAPTATISPKVAEFKRLVELGEYRVDPHQVADAMLRWAEREVQTLGRRGPRSRAQNECSYPSSSRPASMKVTPGCPSATLPIHVKAALAVGQAA